MYKLLFLIFSIHSESLSTNALLLPEGGLYREVSMLLPILIEVVSIIPFINGESYSSYLNVSLMNIRVPPPLLPALCVILASLKH
jgi:hypothetical protein